MGSCQKQCSGKVRQHYRYQDYCHQPVEARGMHFWKRRNQHEENGCYYCDNNQQHEFTRQSIHSPRGKEIYQRPSQSLRELTTRESLRRKSRAQDSFKDRSNPCEHLVHDGIRKVFQFLGAARLQIKRARLIAPDYAGGSYSRAAQRYSKSSRAREASAGGDRKHDRHPGYTIKRLGRDDQNWTTAFLLMAMSRIEADQPDLSAFH